MPKIIDEQARRESIAEAVWAIASREGLEAATVRAVAAECGLSTGAIQHSFATQAALQQFAMELIVRRVSDRINALSSEKAPGPTANAPAPASAVADLLLQLLPLDQERETEARVWAAFSTAALTNPALAPYAREMDALLGAFCRRCLKTLDPASDEPALIRTAAALHALLDGLTLHLLADPSTAQRRQATAIVRAFLQTLLP